MKKKTCETQTDPVEKSIPQNTLPRTVSPMRVTDELFPRSNLIYEKVAHEERCPGADEPFTKETPPISVSPVHPLSASLTRFRKEKKEEKTSTSVLFPNDGSYSSMESICSQKHDMNLHQEESIEGIIMPYSKKILENLTTLVKIKEFCEVIRERETSHL
ncbi:unnamed protein product [Angiostrongylus costaricensis]|uniref:CDT1 domain-containing protein n=1 Tax=Angiostrongylus costaricensis TaxID=334426 RepID=A0A0R3PVN5_ANGCS|nr:unnamed protein product [Angiostrongylus costaricensis]